MRDCLVATDMDGTLLNHHDYRYHAALPCLQKLQEQDIPVVLNTSKTFAELEQWQTRLSIDHPFIVENGSAIYIPSGYFSEQVLHDFHRNVIHIDSYQVVVCGKLIDELRDYLIQHPVDAEDLSACSLQQAIDMTGLTESEARLAQTRQFSIPLRFADDNTGQVFAEQALSDGFGVLRGGRFLHLIGETDKGQSQLVLKALYEKARQAEMTLIALGDSPNDLQMLEAADIAVLVNSPSSDKCRVNHPQLICTQQPAPEGWVEGIEQALSMVDDNANRG